MGDIHRSTDFPSTRERVDDPGMELAAGPAVDLRPGCRECGRPAVGAVADDHFERIGDRDDARPDGDGLAFEAPRIPGPVEPLAVGAHDLCRVLERRLFAHDLVPAEAVPAHDEPLLRGQGPGLSQDRPCAASPPSLPYRKSTPLPRVYTHREIFRERGVAMKIRSFLVVLIFALTPVMWAQEQPPH